MKHGKQIFPDANLNREGTERMAPDRAVKSNLKGHHLLNWGKTMSWNPGCQVVLLQWRIRKISCYRQRCLPPTPSQGFGKHIKNRQRKVVPQTGTSFKDLAKSVEKPDKPKTTFPEQASLFGWKSMPSVPYNAPVTCQRAMKKTLASFEQRMGSSLLCYGFISISPEESIKAIWFGCDKFSIDW